MAEFKVGDRVWWTDGRGLRHAAVVIDPAVRETGVLFCVRECEEWPCSSGCAPAEIVDWRPEG